MTFQASSPETADSPHLEEALGTDPMPLIHFALDLLDVAILLADIEGRIVFANRAASRLLGRRSGLAVQHGRLRARTSAATQALLCRIRAAAGAEPHPDSSQATIALPTASGRPLMTLVLPCREEGTSGSVAPFAILFVGDGAGVAGINERYLSIAYDLTPAEARLLRLLLAGQRLADCARDAHITLLTAKGYLKQIFSKTGARRQADLVRLVLSDPVPRLIAMPQARPASNEAAVGHASNAR